MNVYTGACSVQTSVHALALTVAMHTYMYICGVRVSHVDYRTDLYRAKFNDDLIIRVRSEA